MCRAFSCIVLQNGDVKWKMGLDSHSDILQHFGLPDNECRQDMLRFARVEITPDNKNYIYPDNWTLKVDQVIKPSWFTPSYELFAQQAREKWYAEIEKILVKKPIVNPFEDIEPPTKITQRHINLLKKWASVWSSMVRYNAATDNVMDIVGSSVMDIVKASVGFSVRASVRPSVGNIVGPSVMASVWDSVGNSVGSSVWSSVWDGMWAYIGSFFKLPRKDWRYTKGIKTKQYPFKPAVDLWEMGLVPSCNGTTMRLYGGKDVKVLWEGKI
jgi:hypothetical protein